MTDIIDKYGMGELQDNEDAQIEDFAATHKPTEESMEFHVRMQNYTLRDFDNMVVEAAARVLLGSRCELKLAQQIQDKCIELTQKRITAALEPVTADIIDRPVIPGHVLSSSKKTEPVTMREFIGLCGREFLEQRVRQDGTKTTSSSPYSSDPRRIEWMVSQALDAKFRKEFQAASNEIIGEFKSALKKTQAEMLAIEKTRIRDAFDKGVQT